MSIHTIYQLADGFFFIASVLTHKHVNIENCTGNEPVLPGGRVRSLCADIKCTLVLFISDTSSNIAKIVVYEMDMA